MHDKRVLKLVGRYLQAGVMAGGLVHASEEGTPQGSPLSPLLSNIMLDDDIVICATHDPAVIGKGDEIVVLERC